MSPTESTKFQDGAQLKAAIISWEEEQCVSNPNCDTAERWGFPMDSWAVGLVEDMSSLFAEMTNFNQDIGSWDTSR